MTMQRERRPAMAAALLCLAAVLLAACKVEKAALARQVALEDPDLRFIPDGVYEASYTIEPRSLSSSKATLVPVSRLMESQRLSVDAISGATITSMAVLKAVQDAVAPTGK